MAKRTRRKHLAAFKAKVALAVRVGDKTLAELAHQFALYNKSGSHSCLGKRTPDEVYNIMLPKLEKEA